LVAVATSPSTTAAVIHCPTRPHICTARPQFSVHSPTRSAPRAKPILQTLDRRADAQHDAVVEMARDDLKPDRQPRAAGDRHAQRWVTRHVELDDVVEVAERDRDASTVRSGTCTPSSLPHPNGRGDHIFVDSAVDSAFGETTSIEWCS